MNTEVATPASLLPTHAAAVGADRDPRRVYLASLSPGSRRAVGGRLEKFARVLSDGELSAAVFPWHCLQNQHMAHVRAELLASGYSPSTINGTLAAVRGVLRRAWRLGHMSREQMETAGTVPVASCSFDIW